MSPLDMIPARRNLAMSPPENSAALLSRAISPPDIIAARRNRAISPDEKSPARRNLAMSLLKASAPPLLNLAICSPILASLMFCAAFASLGSSWWLPGQP